MLGWGSGWGSADGNGGGYMANALGGGNNLNMQFGNGHQQQPAWASWNPRSPFTMQQSQASPMQGGANPPPAQQSPGLASPQASLGYPAPSPAPAPSFAAPQPTTLGSGQPKAPMSDYVYNQNTPNPSFTGTGGGIGAGGDLLQKNKLAQQQQGDSWGWPGIMRKLASGDRSGWAF